jgi:hypothetical protein
MPYQLSCLQSLASLVIKSEPADLKSIATARTCSAAMRTNCERLPSPRLSKVLVSDSVSQIFHRPHDQFAALRVRAGLSVSDAVSLTCYSDRQVLR